MMMMLRLQADISKIVIFLFTDGYRFAGTNPTHAFALISLKNLMHFPMGPPNTH